MLREEVACLDRGNYRPLSHHGEFEAALVIMKVKFLAEQDSSCKLHRWYEAAKVLTVRER